MNGCSFNASCHLAAFRITNSELILPLVVATPIDISWYFETRFLGFERGLNGNQIYF